MDMAKYAGENFIKLEDVRACPLQVQIAVVKEGQYEKPNLVFETGETLGLNASNNRILMRAYGRDSDGWIGKQIELFAGEIEYQKKMQPAVVVRPISPPAKKVGDLNDEVAF